MDTETFQYGTVRKALKIVKLLLWVMTPHRWIFCKILIQGIGEYSAKKSIFSPHAENFWKSFPPFLVKIMKINLGKTCKNFE